jgi:outer membrane lipoprotein SlyB
VPTAAPASIEATKASLAANEAVVEPAVSGDKPATGNATQVPPQRQQAPAASTHRHVPAPPQSQAQSGGSTTPLSTQPAVVCTHCGVIEGVREVKQKGRATGLGAVAGGVLGGAVGNQVGRGNGRTAMTVLGAIGGGLAGNEVEKHARSETVYEVRVRMDDGTLRTLQQKTAPAPGARVIVEGNTLRTTRAQEGDGSMMRTSSSTGT